MRSLQKITQTTTFFTLLLFFSSQQLFSQNSKSDIRLEEFASGLGGENFIAPTELVPLPDKSGRLAVATFNGVVRLLNKDGDFIDSKNFYLDTRKEPNRLIPRNNRFGLTAIAFHPDFSRVAADGKKYAGFGKFYTILSETNRIDGNPNRPDLAHGLRNSQDAHQDILVEWRTENPESNEPVFRRRDVLRMDQPHGNHNVTDMAFGPDSLLYLSGGDGGSGQRERASQDRETYIGCVLRIDPLHSDAEGLRSTDPKMKLRISSTTGSQEYQVPSENPGVGIPVQVDEIFAIGFRSPFRMNFDTQTGHLYLGDVGENKFEEINRVEINKNYGWGRFEANRVHRENIELDQEDEHTAPLFHYGREIGETVIAGFVYRGTKIKALKGKYIFGDMGRQVRPVQLPSTAKLFVGDLSSSEMTELSLDPSGEQLAIDEDGQAMTKHFILGIGEDLIRELYVLVGTDPQFKSDRDPIEGKILKITSAIK